MTKVYFNLFWNGVKKYYFGETPKHLSNHYWSIFNFNYKKNEDYNFEVLHNEIIYELENIQINF